MLISNLKLQGLIADPSRVKELTLEAVLSLRGDLAKLDSLLLTRLMSSGTAQAEPAPQGDRLVDVKQAAAKLGCSKTGCIGKPIPYLSESGRVAA